jgi:FkbM family methyltransferase
MGLSSSFPPPHTQIKHAEQPRGWKHIIHNAHYRALFTGGCILLFVFVLVGQPRDVSKDGLKPETIVAPGLQSPSTTSAMKLFGDILDKQIDYCSHSGPFQSVMKVGNDDFSINLQLVDGMRTGGSVYSLYALMPDQSGMGKDIVSDHIAFNKEWESGEISWLLDKLDAFAKKKKLPRSEVFVIDIGANIGTWSFPIAAAGYQVLAFEAMDVNQKSLQYSFCVNILESAPQLKKNLVLFNTGLGKEKAVCNVFSDPANMLDGLVSCTQEEPPFSYLKWRQHLDIARLDDVLGKNLNKLVGKVGAVKMDTEGMEPWVIEGAKKFFKKVAPKYFVTELNEAALKASTNYSAMDFINQILSFGYEMRTGGFDKPAWTKDMIKSEFGIESDKHLLNLYMIHK